VELVDDEVDEGVVEPEAPEVSPVTDISIDPEFADEPPVTVTPAPLVPVIVIVLFDEGADPKIQSLFELR